MKPRPNTWNDLDISEVDAETRLQAQQRQAAEALSAATKEIYERVGLQGSVSTVKSGGVVIGAGQGVGAYTGGIRKSNIEADGDVFIGSNVDQPEGVSFAVFVNAQPYNNEEMDEGDVLIGNNSTGFSNMKWDANEGQFQFRYGTTITAYMDTDGTLKFLAGEIGGWEITSTAIQKLTSNIGIVLDSATPKVQVGNISGVHILLDGDNEGIRSSNFVTGLSGFNIAADTGDAEFNNITARGELKTFLFTASNQMAVAGNIIVSKDAGKLGADVSSVATTVNFGKALTVGNWIKIQGPDDAGNNNLEWMLIGSLVSGTTYNVTRNVDGSGANGWLKDTPFVVIGASGDSRIELVAGASGSIQLITQGAAWNTQTVQASMSTVAGAITAGGDTVLMDSTGIKVIATGLLALSNGYKFVDTADTTKILGGLYSIARHSPNNDAYVELRAAPQDGSLATVYASVDSVASNTAAARLTSDSSLNAGSAAALTVEQTATGRIFTTNIDTIDLQAAVVINDDGAALTFRVATSTHSNTILAHGSSNYVSFFGDNADGLVIIDNGTDKRLEIGQDHYFPTRSASNKNVYINEANQDMDTFIGGTSEDVVQVDAGLNAVGFGGAAESGYKAKVTGDAKVTGKVVQGGAAWTAWTPTITASSGTFTTVSGAGRYYIDGKVVHYECAITITTNGTAAGIVKATLPAAAGTAQTTGSGYGYIGLGQRANDNKSLNVVINSGGTDLNVILYDGAYPGADGYILVVSGVYEIP